MPLPGDEDAVILLLGFERHADGSRKSDVAKVQHDDRIITIDEVSAVLVREKKRMQLKLGQDVKPRLLIKADEEVRSGELHKLGTIAEAAGFSEIMILGGVVTIEIPAANERLAPRDLSPEEPPGS